MVKPQPNLAAQNVFRMDVQKVSRPESREFVEVWAEFEVGSPALVYARDLRLKSIENMQLTIEGGANQANNFDLIVQKQIMNKGRKGNTASIYVWDAGSTAHVSGSVYVNILAMGE